MATRIPLQPWTYSHIETKSSENQMICFEQASQFQLLVKRVFDFVMTFVGLAIISPLMVIITLLVYFTSPGPVLYKSLRVGKNGRYFYMYKFRTMVIDAEKQRAALYDQAGLHGQLFKLKDDPRLTRIGGFLRQYSLDEFPQLINVLRGEMSLVGPRPLIPEESTMFKPPYTSRFGVMPGMTGPWQVSGRSTLSFEQLCKLEWEYVQNWGFWTDILLLLRTIPSVLIKQGAY